MSATAAQPTVFELQDITVDFGGAAGPVLRELNLHVPAGQFITIVGPSGCGKSTLLRLLAGLQQPSAGSIARQNSDGPAPGFVFQQPALLPWRTVLQNLRLPCELGRSQMRQNPAEDQLLDLLGQVGLNRSDVDKRPAELSGGMQMRLSLARALVRQPQVLLLDEPFAAVDDLLRMKLQELVRELHDRRGLTTILVTHNLQEAAFLSDRVLVLQPAPAGFTADISIHTADRDENWRVSDQVTVIQQKLTKALISS